MEGTVSYSPPLAPSGRFSLALMVGGEGRQFRRERNARTDRGSYLAVPLRLHDADRLAGPSAAQGARNQDARRIAAGGV